MEKKSVLKMYTPLTLFYLLYFEQYMPYFLSDFFYLFYLERILNLDLLGVQIILVLNQHVILFDCIKGCNLIS